MLRKLQLHLQAPRAHHHRPRQQLPELLVWKHSFPRFQRKMKTDANRICSTTPRRVWRTPTPTAGRCGRRSSSPTRCCRCRSSYVNCSASRGPQAPEKRRSVADKNSSSAPRSFRCPTAAASRCWCRPSSSPGCCRRCSSYVEYFPEKTLPSELKERC